MESITHEDLLLVNELYKRTYSENTILSNASKYERSQILLIRRKLKSIAIHFAKKYSEEYGPFDTEMSTGNPVGRGSNLNHVWAGLFKGNSNKQYAAQISFVINRSESCLDVGFYFGRASARSLVIEERQNLKRQFIEIGKNLATSLNNNESIENRYNSLFDFGFEASVNGKTVSPSRWREEIAIDPYASQIVAKIYPKGSNAITESDIDSYVGQVIFLMRYINRVAKAGEIIPQITPQQYIKQAERNAEIGLKGELFILKQEKLRLEKLGYNSDYPRHVALESNRFGFDILSKNDEGEDIYIEVKSTTRLKEDFYSRRFFLTNFEHDTYIKHKNIYKLARVYDVENEATYEYIDLETVSKKSDGFIVEY